VKTPLRRFFVLFLTLHVFGYALGQSGDLITAVSVSGLTRTKPQVAEQRLKRFLGQEAASVDSNEVRAAILDTGILEPVSVEIEDDPEGGGKTLAITVREKWTIFPVPVFYYVGSGDWGAGGFFMDANAFGLNDKMLAGGMYSSGSWMAMAMYMNTPERDHVPGWNIAGFFSREERKNTDQKNHDIRRFNLNSWSGSLGIRYPLGEFFSPSISFSVTDAAIRGSPFPLEAPEKGARIVTISPGISLQKSQWDGYLLSQQSADLEYTYTVGIDYPSSHSVSLKTTNEWPLIPGFKVGVKSGLIYDPNGTAIFESGPSAAQTDILPRAFSARNYAGVSANIEKYLVKFSFGTLSALASYQVVWSRGPLLGYQFDHGPAASVRFYLSTLAFPALGLGLAYNVAAGYLQGSINMGMSF
jgi:outer membrane protein assembly factor BamA